MNTEEIESLGIHIGVSREDCSVASAGVDGLAVFPTVAGGRNENTHGGDPYSIFGELLRCSYTRQVICYRIEPGRSVTCNKCRQFVPQPQFGGIQLVVAKVNGVVARPIRMLTES